MDKLLFWASDFSCFALDTVGADQWHNSFCSNPGTYHAFGIAVWVIAIMIAFGVSDVLANRRRTPSR